MILWVYWQRKDSAGINQHTAHCSWQCSIATLSQYRGTNFSSTDGCVSRHKKHTLIIQNSKVSFLETNSSDNAPSQTPISVEEEEGGGFYLNRVPVYGEIKAALLDESQISVSFTLILPEHFCWIIEASTHTPGVTHAVIHKKCLFTRKRMFGNTVLS